MGHKSRKGGAESPEEYLAAAPKGQQALFKTLRDLVLETVPASLLAMKWGAPVFVLATPYAYLGCFRKTVNLGFVHGAQLRDPKGLLKGAGREGRHLEFRTIGDIDRPAVRALLRQAASRAR